MISKSTASKNIVLLTLIVTVGWAVLACSQPEHSTSKNDKVDASAQSTNQISTSKDSRELMHEMLQGFSIPAKDFEINDIGKPDVLDYNEYGEFVNLGQPGYKFVIKNRDQLKADIGQGIYPNNNAVRKDENFKAMQQQGLFKDSHWAILKSNNKQQAFYKWATVGDDQGVKQYFIGTILEQAGHLIPALKAYYAAAVHFPKSVGWAADGSFVWYIAPAAMGSIKRICRDYPDLNLDYVDSMFKVVNGGDTNLKNDEITIHPGRFVKKTFSEKMQKLPKLSEQKIVEQRGEGRVRVVKYQNGHWQLLVDNQPQMVRAVTYGPTVIGIGPHNDPNYDMRWMMSDRNKNKIIDAPYEAWVDANGNGQQDQDEPNVGDFKLMQEMGLNSIRIYIPNKTNIEYDPSLVNKELLRDLHATYGISVIAGDFLGAYTVGSGASWTDGTDYTDPDQRAQMKEIVRQKVLDLKDEPFILMWLLGNENNMGSDDTGVNATRTNASSQPQAYAEFLNEVAEMIHELDPNHPVAIGNLGTGLSDYYNKYAPAIDILGANLYMGTGGFGTIWSDVKRDFDRPLLITEYGADAFDEALKDTNEQAQSDYHYGNLRDIVLNQAGGVYQGNSIGGIIFEYLDEWWKDTHGHPEDVQQRKPQYPSASFDGYNHEEWFGIVGQGSGQHSPFERRLRKAYFMYKDNWN